MTQIITAYLKVLISLVYKFQFPFYPDISFNYIDEEGFEKVGARAGERSNQGDVGAMDV